MSNGSQNSSNSFSLLPSKPKIFHGRESELQHIIKVLAQEAPRIAILGGGGMGKTSLARAALHHSETCSRFQARFFVSAEAATTVVELAALIGLHLGLDPGSNLVKPVVRYFDQQTSSCLLVLDNLETPWEPLKSRSAVEDFLSLLAGVTHLALIITMRGAERPGKVQWTRPFLPPLEPLPNDAALQLFEDITDDLHPSDERTQLLQFTENMPLALDLMAHLVEYEGLSNVLTWWKTEKTSLLSIGYDRGSNMDTSIALSLSSPRITPHSRKLLSLLSILPDGLSDVELAQSKLPINDILTCKSVLIATALAYKDNKGRLRSLVPIREHVRQFFPPSEAVVQSLRKSFHDLLALYQKYRDSRLSNVIALITINLANLDEVLQWGLQPKSLDLGETIESTISLNVFYRETRGRRTHLLNEIPIHLCGPRQRVLHINECLRGLPGEVQTQKLLSEAISQFEHFQDPILEVALYLVAARSSWESGLWIEELQLLEQALTLSKSSEADPTTQYLCLIEIATSKWRSGDFVTALALGRQAKQFAYLATDLVQASRALSICAMSRTFLGDYPGAMVQIQKAKELLILCGMTSSDHHHNLLNCQAEIHQCKSEYAEARKIHDTNLQESALDPSAEGYVITLINIAQIDIIIGTKKELVYQNLETAYKICNITSFPRGVTWCDLFSGHLNLREGNSSSARALFQDCLKSSLGKENDVMLYCLEQLADITQWPTEFRRQCKWPVLYLCQTCKTKDRLGFSKALLFIADLFLEDDDTAQSLLTLALEEFTFMDVHRSRAQCMMRLGDLAQKRGNITEAVDLWKSARPLFGRSFQAKDVARIDERLSAFDPLIRKPLQNSRHSMLQ
ncbi:P-loop containing nucleoside triphosphate hydrolase protein [Mycena filopes]|nr:P-loop containing nucleoside triphosphate hydrolase protein [Mycena filopes]